jgi:hypothetical protein
MTRIDVSFLTYFTSKRNHHFFSNLRETGVRWKCVTVGSNLNERDLRPRLPHSLSLYTILAYFLLSWTIHVRKKIPCGPFFVFPTQGFGLLLPNLLVDTPLFPLPFPRCQSLDLFLLPDDWRPEVCDFAPPFDLWISPRRRRPWASSGKLIYKHLS